MSKSETTDDLVWIIVRTDKADQNCEFVSAHLFETDARSKARLLLSDNCYISLKTIPLYKEQS